MSGKTEITLGPKAESFDKLSEKQSKKLWRFKKRAPLPPGTHAEPAKPEIPEKLPDRNLNTVTLVLDHNGIEYDMGTVTYSIETVNTLKYTWLAQTAPYLCGPPGQPQRLLVISGFFSKYEHEYKGIGSAMLDEIVQLAILDECPWIVVAGGINPDVYKAFDFQRIDTVDTWCISTAKLQARLAGRSDRWNEV